jgi:hypothetical protein
VGLSFTIATGLRQRSHSRVRVPRDLLTYLTVSDSRLPLTGGPSPSIYIPQKQGHTVITPGTGADRTENSASNSFIDACLFNNSSLWRQSLLQRKRVTVYYSKSRKSTKCVFRFCEARGHCELEILKLV